MRLLEFFTESEVDLDLDAEDKDSALRELVGLLGLEPEAGGILFRLLRKRENLGSTGIGRHVAIPHCRSLVVDRLRIAYGRKPKGLEFEAMDGKPVHHLFLIIAPAVEISNQYLPVLGKIAQFCKDQHNLDRLDRIEGPEEFFELLDRADI
jgi:mannitol/fructose-specific phosphotransferase system IIA component (Ntr-type)